MQRTNILIILSAMLWAFVSCGKGKDPSPDLPDWGKNSTISIQFYSRLGNDKLFRTEDYSAVIGRIRVNQNHIAVLHRVDAVYNLSEMQNPTVIIAAEAVKIPLFAWSRYSSAQVEGSGILLGQTVTEMKNTPISDGCAYFSVPVLANGGININFATLTFENENQLTTGIPIIKTKLDDKTVLVGVAAKTLQSKLKIAFPEGNYHLETIEPKDAKATQVIFIVTTPKWGLDECKETAVGTDGISCYDINIEKL